MAKQKVLITVKTYPSISSTHNELVCTAGFTESGEWIRIYPIKFRHLDYANQYKKYDWIEIDLVKNGKDVRPESYRPITLETEPQVISHVDTADNWSERKKTVLKHVYTDLTKLIEDAKNKDICRSLAVFKPTKVIDFYWEKEKDREWDQAKLDQLKQLNLFESRDRNPKNITLVRKLPYKFHYVFEDCNGKRSEPMIEDWEVGALFWKYENEEEACQMVKKKYFDDFAKTKDLYFFLGTTLAHHHRSKNPFMIIGTFHPTFPKLPKVSPQLTLNF